MFGTIPDPVPNRGDQSPESIAEFPDTDGLRVLGTWEVDFRSATSNISESLRDLSIKPEEAAVREWSYLALVHPEDRPRVGDLHQHASRIPGVTSGAHRIRTYDGKVLAVVEVVRSEASSEGEVVGMSGTVLDLTDLLEPVAQVQNNAVKGLLAVEASGDGTWELNTSTGEVQFSPRFGRLLGFLDNEVPTTLGAWTKLIHPDEARAFIQSIESARQGHSVRLTCEIRCLCKEGGYRHFLLRGAFVNDRLMGIFSDVTQTRREEMQLKEAYETLRAVCEGSFETYFVLGADRNPDGLAIDFVFRDLSNKAERMLGLPRERILGRRLTEVAPASRTDGSLDRFLQSLHSRESLDDEVVLAHGGLYSVHLQRRVFPVPNGVVVTTTDVTALSRAERALHDSERFVQRITAAIPDLLFLWDLQTDRHVYRNRDILQDLGYGPDDRARFHDWPIAGLMHPDDKSMLDRLRASAGELSDDQVTENYIRLRTASGEFRHYRIRLSVFNRDAQGRPIQLMGTAQDVTLQRTSEYRLRDQMASLEQARGMLEARQHELEQLNARLGTLATTDSLTGLKNYRAFQERLLEEIERSRRYGTPLSLLLMDVDLFKEFNDANGHPAGDEMLRVFGDVLLQQARTSDVVARYGGEEFAIILPNTTAKDAAILAERIRHELRNREVHGSSITSSFGCAELKPIGEGKSQLIGDADRALYRSKHEGRDRVTIAD